MICYPRRIARFHTGIALLSASLFVFAGCSGESDFRPRAVGQDTEILVVADSMDWNGDIGEALRETVGQFISTLPAPERQFELRHVPLETEDDLEVARRRKNVIFVAAFSDSTNEAAYIRNVFDSNAQQTIREEGGVAVSRENIFRRDQQVYYITGENKEDVIDAIYSTSEGLSRDFNRAARRRLTEEMFDRGRQFEVEEELAEMHDFAVNVQHDYLVAVDTSDFVWLRRILPETWRSVFVHFVDYADPEQLSPEWIYNTRDSLARQYIQGNLGGWVEIDRRKNRPLETKNVDFLGRYGFETRGLWHMVGVEEGQKVEFGMGGPFITYTFYDQPTGRLYMIDGMVFAPGYNKREFLRQMEAIAYTFRSRDVSTEGKG